jgi:4-hydroxyproline epimerase
VGGPYRKLVAIDSHTGGEPTRIVVEGAPALAGSVQEQLAQLKQHHDWIRSASINEPRGSDVLVGGLLLPSAQPGIDAGVIFFNNVGYLGMCGHGTIGLVTTLSFLQRIRPGPLHIATPAGKVRAVLGEDGKVAVDNVPAYRHAADVRLNVRGFGAISGDIAYGGNWFFICDNHGQELVHSRVALLTEFCQAVRHALREAGIAGAGGAEIDHIELSAASPMADARNFVLCPGGAYDRSPCGTGTSAKLACLAADGQWPARTVWRQESITGSIFEASYESQGDLILPTIRGEAFITAEITLLIDAQDPLRFGMPGP